MNMKKFKKFIGEECTVLDLSNELIDLGCDDICNKGELSWLIKEENSISVSTKEFDETYDSYKELNFNFKVIHDDEDINKVVVKIIDVEEI